MINYSKEQIIEAAKIHEELIEEASKITNKYNEIVHGIKNKLYVEELEIKNDVVFAKNNYDWSMDDHLVSTLHFPIEWLFDEDSILEEKINLIKKNIEIEKEKEKIKAAEEKAIKQKNQELETLKRLLEKHPNYNEK